MKEKKQGLDTGLMRRLFGFMGQYKSIFYLCIILTFVLAVFAVTRPWLVQYTIDNFVAAGDTKGVLYMTILMISLLLLQSVVQYYYTYRTNFLGQKVVRKMRTDVYDHVLNFEMAYFDRTPVGTPVTRVISDMETIGSIFSEGVIVIIGDILQLICVLGVMFYIDWRLALISLSSVPLLFIATYIFKVKIRVVFNTVRNMVSQLNVFVQEHIIGMRVVQIFNKEEEEMRKFREINKEHRNAHIRSVWYYSIFFPVVELLTAIALALLVWWGANAVIRGEVTFGTLVMFIMFISMLFRPIRELADKFNTLQMGMVSAERIFILLDRKSGMPQSDIQEQPEIIGEIEFRNVWFAYNEGEWILRDVSFELAPGKMLALVGSTGAGKTTIINLINRFYDIQKGSILIDGVDIRDMDLQHLRSQVAVVLQDVFLFSDSIYNNVALHNSGIKRNYVSDAANKIGADKFIEKMPQSYDYNVQERGSMLSHGQRQLISFMRAYAYDPKILILDEATSSVDAESEEMISAATKTLTSNRSSIVIAHRLSTVQEADKILVMEKGQIKEEGTHQELLKAEGLYKQLYEIQFKHSQRQKAG